MLNSISMMLKAPSGTVRRTAVREMERLGAGTRVVRLLNQMAVDPDPTVSGEAVRVLSRFGQHRSVAHALLHPQSSIRRQAAVALGKLGAKAKPALSYLIAVLKDDCDSVRIQAALTLGRIGPAAHPAIPALIQALKGNHLILARLAAQALTHLGPQAVAPLVETLQSPDGFVRREAVWALGEILRTAAPHQSFSREQAADLPTPPRRDQPTVPTAVDARKDYEAIRRRQANPMCRVESTSTCNPVEAIRAATADNDPKVKEAAILALDRLEGVSLAISTE